MEKKRKLGRSLEEVADFWLTSSPISHESDSAGESLPRNAPGPGHGFTNKTISILYPESLKVKGLLLANFALELAKQGYGSCILDYEPHDSPVRLIMDSLFQSFSKGDDSEEPSPFHRVLKLYGLPGIHLFSRSEESLSHTPVPNITDDLFTQLAGSNLLESIILPHHPDNLEMISMMESLPPIILLVSRPRRESLLVSYAYIKTIAAKNPQAQVWMIMDEVKDRDVAVKAFTCLNQAAMRNLATTCLPLKFLGSIIHDQALGISLATHYPLVLSEQHSVARDSIIRITSNFIKTIENPD
ncbi:MAG: MinD/ParA family ATP-binding protein [bacterium]